MSWASLLLLTFEMSIPCQYLTDVAMFGVDRCRPHCAGLLLLLQNVARSVGRDAVWELTLLCPRNHVNK